MAGVYFIIRRQKDLVRLYTEHGIEWINKMFTTGYEPDQKQTCRIVYDNETNELVVIPIYVDRVITSLTKRIEVLERRVTELSN